ncbi:MAG: hypothetical protein EA421_10290 [Gemmatimonadales bacterium]|nr:MAG: hypothetical protein EA421_10290 [Gemmatimonadales bacterium]
MRYHRVNHFRMIERVLAGSRRAALLLAPLALLSAGPLAAQSCGDLNVAVLRALLPAPAAVEALQEVLVEAYPDSPQASAGRDSFVDGLVGPRTAGLAARLCRELGLEGEGSASTAIQQGAAAFRRVIASHPDWRSHVVSPGFLAWAAELPAGPYTPYYRIPQGGAVAPTSALLLDAYFSSTGLRRAGGGVFEITDEALAALASPPETSRFQVTELSLSRLIALGASPDLVNAVRALRDLPQATDADAQAQLQEVLDTFEETRPWEFEVISLERYRALVEIEEIRPDPALQGEAVPEAVLAGLEKLRGIRFPNARLFQEALRVEARVGASRPALRQRIMTAARLPVDGGVDPSVSVKPIRWEAICGCGTFVKDSDAYPLYLYGLFPFWDAPQEGDSGERDLEPVNFSMLTRVGYYGLTFDAQGSISDPLHWRRGRRAGDSGFLRRSDFSHFSSTAHRFKTELDLVVTNGDWREWLPLPGGSAEDTLATRDRNRQAVHRLGENALSLVTEPIPGILNRLKPIVAFGQSPRPTLGDGLTLDFDFTGLPPGDQAFLLALMRDEFLPGLEKEIRALQEPGRLFDQSKKYFLNLVIPGYCLSEAWEGMGREDCVFYSPGALGELAPYFDLILVDFTKEPPTPGAWARTPSPLAQMRGLQGAMDRLPLATQVAIRDKVLPTLITGGDDSTLQRLEPAVEYGAWNYSGTGLWSVPVAPEVNTLLDSALALEAPSLGGPRFWRAMEAQFGDVGLEDRICGFVCPNRWLLRALVVLAFLALFCVWLASLWWFHLRRLYSTPYAPIAALLLGLFLMTTLWCDPFWSERRPTILLVSFGGLLGYFVYSFYEKRREREYP